MIFCFVLQIITKHADEILIYKISCYQDDTPRRAIQEEISLFLIKLQRYTNDSSYDHEAMNLKKIYQTTKTMMMKLDASDEMSWSAVDICDYSKWIQRNYDG